MRASLFGTLAGGGAAPWTPSSITSAIHRYTASSIVGLSNTDPVDTWPDLIGSGDFTGSGSTRPLYYTNSGDPYVLFDGTDDFMSGTLTALNDFTIWAVVDRLGGADYTRLINDGASTLIILGIPSGPGVSFYITVSDAHAISGPADPTGAMSLFFTRNAAGSTGEWTVNGTGGSGALYNNTTSATWNLCSNAAHGENGNYWIKELLVCNAQLSGGDRTLLATYALDTYGVIL